MALPTAANSPSWGDHATLSHAVPTAVVAAVQFLPSVEYAIYGVVYPTATNNPSCDDHATPFHDVPTTVVAVTHVPGFAKLE